MDTSRVLTDDIVVESSKYAYNNGFQGFITWHFYNEPLLIWPRTKALMERMKAEIDGVRFGLWTNGDAVGRWVDPAELSTFEACWISNYSNRDFTFLEEHISRVEVFDKPSMDQRKCPKAARKVKEIRYKCLRPWHELIFDYHGHAHPCSMDWQNKLGLGNIFDDGLEVIIEQHRRLRDTVSLVRTDFEDMPEKCQYCLARNMRIVGLVPDVADDQRRYLRKYTRVANKERDGIIAGIIKGILSKYNI